MVRGVYASPDDAAIAALTECFLDSVEQDREFGGRIYHVPSGGFGHTPPMAGNTDHFVLSMVAVPGGTEDVGCYHTHGDFSVGTPGTPGYRRTRRGLSNYSARGLGVNTRDGDFWSQDDIAVINEQARGRPGYRGYLGTAAMIIRYFDPLTGEEGTLFPRVPVRHVSEGPDGDR